MKHLFKNDHDRKLAIKLLKKAKKLIRNESETFVCLAISEAASLDYANTYKTSYALREEIERRIEPYGTVTSWLNSIHDDAWDASTSEIVQYRIRWIDSMIKELK
jgi:hypothetical protein